MKQTALFLALGLLFITAYSCGTQAQTTYPDAPKFVSMDLSSSPQGAAVYQNGKLLLVALVCIGELFPVSPRK